MLPHVVVTSPKHTWLGTQGTDEEDPSVIGVVIGNHLATAQTQDLPDQDVVSYLREQTRRLEPVIIFFRKRERTWEIVPVGELGSEPYVLDPAMNANYMNGIAHFTDAATQTKYLADAAIAIGNDFVGV